MSHKKLLLKGICAFDKENQAPQTPYSPTLRSEIHAGIRPTATPLQLLITAARSSNAMPKSKVNFSKETQQFMTKVRAATTIRDEVQHVSEYEAKLSTYLSNIGTNATPYPHPDLITNHVENEVLDLSTHSERSPIEPLNLTNYDAAESIEQLTKRQASEEIEKPLSKIYRVMKAMEEHSLSMSKLSPENLRQIKCRTPDTVLGPNAQLAYDMQINELPPTPAASPSENLSEPNDGRPTTPTTTHAVTTPDSMPLKQEQIYKVDTPATSVSSSATSEHIDTRQRQFATPHNNLYNCNNKSTTTPKQPITKVYLSMSDEIQKLIDDNTIVKNGVEMVVLGANGTTVNKDLLQDINWAISGPAITRKILMVLFDREVLATHTLSGKPSPAFLNLNKPEKGRLDPMIVSDLMHFMSVTKDMSSREIRNAITTKCADEFKMLRQREYRRQECKQREVRATI